MTALRSIAGLLAATLLCFGASEVLAQSGGLRVRVLDARDETPLAGATVTLTNAQGLIAPTTLLTDEAGWVGFPVLRTGPDYVVDIDMPGFARQRVADHRVSSHRTEQITIVMSPAMQETVRVLAHGDVVELEETGGSSKFDEAFIENMPVPGRFYQNMLTLAPGVLDADADGNPNVHGARERDFRAQVGGVSNVDPLTGEWLSRINSESIEEMEVLPWGAGVEYGRASGGFAQILQRQGSNEFEGVFSLLYGSSSLDGADGELQGLEPDYEWFQPAIQLSGPILRDKLWYRLSWERIKREDPLDLIGQVVVSERDQEMNAHQITWQVSPRNKLAFQYQSDPLALTNIGVSSTVAPESARTLERGGDTYSLIWTAPISSRLLVESQIAYQDHERKLSPQSENTDWNRCALFGAWPGGDDFLSLNYAYCLNEDTGFTTGSYPETSEDRRQRFTGRAQATWYAGRALGANHQVKLGFIAENERYFRELESWPSVTFYTEIVGLGQELGHSVTRVSSDVFSSAQATGANWGLYVEDEIKPVENLVLSVGLRYDREEIDSAGYEPFDPFAEAEAYNALIDRRVSTSQAQRATFTSFPDLSLFQAGLIEAVGADNLGDIPLSPIQVDSTQWAHSRGPASMHIVNDNFSPRLAIAWDPWSNGKTRFSLSAGRYYDKIVLAVPLVEQEPAETVLTWRSIPFSDERIFLVSDAQTLLNPSIRVQTVDRDLRTPYQDEFAFSVEREIAPEMSIRGSYIRRNFEDQLQDIDINHATGDKGYCTLVQQSSMVQTSPGMGEIVRNSLTGEEYVDTDPGPGDGRIDDCTGDIVLMHVDDDPQPDEVERPDGLPDLYQQNPGFGEILMVGNFNTTKYEAFVLELVRRMYRNWQMNASYTWSEAVGDAEDFNQILGNEITLTEDERGFLSFDQRHVVKVSAIGVAPWGLRLGGTVRWESGLPFSDITSKSTVFAVPPNLITSGESDQHFRFRYPTGQRNDQRNTPYWTVDTRVAKEFVLGRRVNMQVSIEVFNLLDDDTLILDDRISGTNSGVRRFGRRWQLGTRIAF